MHVVFTTVLNVNEAKSLSVELISLIFSPLWQIILPIISLLPLIHYMNWNLQTKLVSQIEPDLHQWPSISFMMLTQKSLHIYTIRVYTSFLLRKHLCLWLKTTYVIEDKLPAVTMTEEKTGESLPASLHIMLCSKID